MRATTAAEPEVTEVEASVGPIDNRFHVVAVACQRVLQIRDGARLRIDLTGHKPCVVAVAEVVAGTVPCYLS